MGIELRRLLAVASPRFARAARFPSVAASAVAAPPLLPRLRAGSVGSLGRPPRPCGASGRAVGPTGPFFFLGCASPSPSVWLFAPAGASSSSSRFVCLASGAWVCSGRAGVRASRSAPLPLARRPRAGARLPALAPCGAPAPRFVVPRLPSVASPPGRRLGSLRRPLATLGLRGVRCRASPSSVFIGYARPPFWAPAPLAGRCVHRASPLSLQRPFSALGGRAMLPPLRGRGPLRPPGRIGRRFGRAGGFAACPPVSPP